MKLHTTGTASYPPMEYLPANSAVTYKPGQALVITAGKAALCGATAKPSHICCGEAACGEVPAIRVTDDLTFEAHLSAAGSTDTPLAVGQKVTLAADAIDVTATTTSGVAEIVALSNGTQAKGDPVLVKF